MPRKNRQIPHSPLHFINGCRSKRRFATEREALAAAEYQMLVKMELELAVYKCDLCGGWHLTRQTRSNNQE